MTIYWYCYAWAKWITHKIAKASAIKGSHGSKSFAQSLIKLPFASWATTAIHEALFVIVASTLSLMSRGGVGTKRELNLLLSQHLVRPSSYTEWICVPELLCVIRSKLGPRCEPHDFATNQMYSKARVICNDLANLTSRLLSKGESMTRLAMSVHESTTSLSTLMPH